MALEQQRLDMIGNNVANVNTTGFKRSVAAGGEFAALLLHRMEPRGDGEAPVVGRLGQGAALRQVASDATQGALEVTDGPLDVALVGAGEFVYQGPDGQLGYTRNGSFHRDTQGRLVTADGRVVLVGGAPVGAGAEALTMTRDGVVMVDGQPAGRPDLRGAAADTRLQGGALERSNADLAQEMTEMIIAMRSFQANQRALQAQDETLARAVSDIGRV
jgi:flagellar basal-body rod protein FlgG